MGPITLIFSGQKGILHKAICSSLFLILYINTSLALGDMEFKASTEIATAGNFTLSWNSQGKPMELQESQTEDFQSNKKIYQGTDQATVISGKADGKWYYRIRLTEDSHWSQPLLVTVSHHELSRAFMFLGIGVLVFFATLVMIINGSRTSQ